MKTGFVLIVIIMMFASIRADPPAVGLNEKEFANGEEALISLQGENKDMWIISFYSDQAPADDHEGVKAEIQSEMTKAFPEAKYWFGEIKLNQDYKWQKLYETLGLVGEPKRGHTTPQVLVMQDGEGYVIFGPEIGKAVAKRYGKVTAGKVFGK